MDARVTRCETLRKALSWRVRLEGTSGWGKSAPTVFSIASEFTSTWNGPSKLERLAAKGFRAPIEWLLALSGSRSRVVDPGKKVCCVHVRRPVDAARGVPKETRNPCRHSSARCTVPRI